MFQPTIKINTPDNLDYCYFPISKSIINFGVKAAHDARIALRTSLREDSNLYEIIIGGWGNSMSAIKRNKSEPDVAEADTREILDESEVCFFWIQWSCDGLLSVGHLGAELGFMSFQDMEPFALNFVGFSTSWGATGEWIIEDGETTLPAVRQELLASRHYWVDYNGSQLPRSAVIAHEDGLFIGRARHRRSVTPGGIRGKTCYITWGGVTHEKSEFQVLCAANTSWVKSWRGSLPMYALPAGETEDGIALFIGRVFHNGVYHIGKIQTNHQTCYIPHNGQEVAHCEYETLVLIDYPVMEHIGR